MTITGDFETHLTLASPDAVAAGTLQNIAGECRLKVTHILLQRGRQPSQLMLTRHSTETFDESLTAARELAARLAARGLPVSRMKIEIDADNPAAPADELKARANPPERYFEFHVKVILPSLADLEHLGEVACRNAAQLSKNAFVVRPDGREERFVTQRFYGIGRDKALPALVALTNDLRQYGFAILDCEAEYVIFDSNIDLDAGWLDAR